MTFSQLPFQSDGTERKVPTPECLSHHRNHKEEVAGADEPPQGITANGPPPPQPEEEVAGADEPPQGDCQRQQVISLPL